MTSSEAGVNGRFYTSDYMLALKIMFVDGAISSCFSWRARKMDHRGSILDYMIRIFSPVQQNPKQLSGSYNKIHAFTKIFEDP